MTAGDPRSIVITGASAGLGAALAQRYAGPGVRLGLVARNAGRLAATARACEAAGAETSLGAIDVTDAEALGGWLGAFDDASPVELVIANAGVSGSLAPGGAAEPLAVARRQLRVNLEGVVNTATPLAERMRRRGHGRIALMSSLAALRALPSAPAYSASKAGVLAYGAALRGWLRPYGVGVTVICPGFVTTAMSARYRGRKPLEMPADRAASLIARRLARAPALIAFPWPLALGTRLSALLPPALSDRLMAPFAFEVEPES